jgi:hypothetical protein
LDILFLSIGATLCGVNAWEEIEDFGREKLDWLRRYFSYKEGISKHDTLTRELKILQKSFISWMNSASKFADAEVIATNRKVVRG